MSVDPITPLRTLLLADSAVAARVGTRVYGGELEDDATAMPRANVVLKPAGGPGFPGDGNDFGKIRIDVVCYAATLHEAWLLYLDVEAVLNGISRRKSDGVLLHSASVSSKGTTARDPEKQWPTTYSSWLVLASRVAAA